MIAMMKWHDVQVFLAVAQHGSLVEAADALGVNHSTVYRRLAALESDLGLPLFDRVGGRYRLSEVGAAAFPHAQDVAAALASFQRTVDAHDERLSGTVLLTAPESLLQVLTPHLSAFREAHPSIDLQVHFGDRFFDLAKQEADVALRPTSRPPEDLHGRRVSAIAWAVYAPVDEAADTLPWGVYTDDLAELPAAQWRRRTYPDSVALLSVNTVPAMQEVLKAAHCRGLLPCFRGDVDPSLRRLTPPLPDAESALWLLVHPDLRRAARVRALLDALWQSLRSDVGLLEGRG